MTFTKRFQFFVCLALFTSSMLGCGESSETTQPALPVGTDDQGVADVPTTEDAQTTPEADANVDPEPDSEVVDDTDTEVSGPTFDGDPMERGPQVFTKETLELSLDRDITIDIYKPEGISSSKVIIFHHGFMLNGSQYQSYGEHLASWGFTAILPTVQMSLTGEPNHRELKETLLALLDWVDTSAEDMSHPLYDAVQTGAYGLAGHSLGGKLSFYAATEDERVKGVVGADPVDATPPIPGISPDDFPSITPERMDLVNVPFLAIGQTDDGLFAPADNNFEQYFNNGTSPAGKINILNTSHTAFMDQSGCTDTADNPCSTQELTQGFLTAFFQVILYGNDNFIEYVTGSGFQAQVNAGRITGEFKNGFLGTN